MSAEVSTEPDRQSSGNSPEAENHRAKKHALKAAITRCPEARRAEVSHSSPRPPRRGEITEDRTREVSIRACLLCIKINTACPGSGRVAVIVVLTEPTWQVYSDSEVGWEHPA